MEGARNEEKSSQGCCLTEKGTIYPQAEGADFIPGQSEDKPPSYEIAQLISSQHVSLKQEDNRPMQLILAEVSPAPEPDCGDYCWACFCPPFYVSQKRGCCGIDCWINVIIGSLCGWPCVSIHALTMVGEPDYVEPNTPVIFEQPVTR